MTGLPFLSSDLKGLQMMPSLLSKRFELLRGFNRDLKFILVSLAFRRVVMGFLEVVRAIYFAIIGFSPAEIGFLFTIPIATGALRSGIVGVLADKYGRKIFILLGNLFSTLRLIIYVFSRDYWALALAQALGAFGEGGGAGQPSVSALIADKTDSRDRTHVFSIIALTNSGAAILGSLMAGTPALFQSKLNLDVISSYALLFLIGALFSVLAALLVLPVREERKNQQIEEKSGKLLPEKSWGIIGKFSLVRCVGGLGFGMVTPLLPLYFYMKFSTGSEVLGPFYALSRFLSMVLYLFADDVVELVGEVGSIVASRLASLIGIFLLPFAPSFHLAAILLVLIRAPALFTVPIRQSFITLIVDPSESASAVGISNMARMGVRSIAPALTGYIFESISLNVPFFLGGILIGVNALLYKFFFGRDR